MERTIEDRKKELFEFIANLSKDDSYLLISYGKGELDIKMFGNYHEIISMLETTKFRVMFRDIMENDGTTY